MKIVSIILGVPFFVGVFVGACVVGMATAIIPPSCPATYVHPAVYEPEWQESYSVEELAP